MQEASLEQGPKPKTIPITFDKSHLVTIGEKLYSESIELIRELVNNAYDADATVINVIIEEDKIVVDDNGSGMDEEGLRQYFNIGSAEKREHSRSPVYRRHRIGEFGIGKFASLSAAGRFEVSTRKDDFSATVIFDKDDWNQNKTCWELPLRYDNPHIWKTNGTRVTLTKLTRKFNLEDVERRILEGVPIKAENFAVYLNHKRITARFLAGQRIPIFEGCDYGVISGEIIIVSNPAAIMGGSGIDIKVKGVTIKKELFGLEGSSPLINNLSGEIHADFLPITSDRTGFIVDSPEYQDFRKTMLTVMQRVMHDVRYYEGQKEKKRVRRVVNAAIEKVVQALRKNPELASLVGLPVEPEEKGKEAKLTPPLPQPKRPRRTPAQKRIVSKLIGPSSVISKLRMGNKGISCQVDHYGENAPESYTEGSIIYINLDHPLYKRESKNRERLMVHLARLLTQEISLMQKANNPRQAFERQSRLLTDALVEKY